MCLLFRRFEKPRNSFQVTNTAAAATTTTTNDDDNNDEFAVAAHMTAVNCTNAVVNFAATNRPSAVK